MTEEFKQYIAALTRVCRDETFHGEYDLNFKWLDKPSERDTAKSRTFASINMETTYLWATVWIYPAMFEQYQDKNYKGCAKDILHEICHLFIEPVAVLFMWDSPTSQREYHNNTIERQTERITKTIFALLPDDWYTPFALGLEEDK